MASIKTIGLFCTGSTWPDESMAQSIRAWMQDKYQIKVVYHEDCYSFLSPERRAQIILDMASDDSIDCLWAIKGGEGSADCIPFLQKNLATLKSAQAKPILGFSDITAILLFFSQELHWPCVHAATPAQFVGGRVDLDSIEVTMNYLLNKSSVTIDDLHPLNNQANNEFSGYLTGGNLSLLNISISDIWQLQAKDKIVFVEEINEAPHVILRTLKYLLRIGAFDGAIGLIIGQCSGLSDDARERLQRGLKYFVEQCPFPVWQSTMFGHESRNYPLPYSELCHIKSGCLIVQPAN